MEGPAQDAGPHPHGITEGLKQQKLSPSGEDKDPPELVSDPAGWTEHERIWEPAPPPQPSGLPEPAGRFCRGATRSKAWKLRMATDTERYRER